MDIDFGTLQSAQKVLLIIEDANALSVEKRDIPSAWQATGSVPVTTTRS
jgi:hypothetical protein